MKISMRYRSLLALGLGLLAMKGQIIAYFLDFGSLLHLLSNISSFICLFGVVFLALTTETNK